MSDEKQTPPMELKSEHVRFIIVMVFIPIMVLVGVFGIGFLFVAVVTGELPATEAITTIVKNLLDFIASLLGAGSS